ncbi:9515_t:CDS:1, partial [Paraglomus occultum]
MTIYCIDDIDPLNDDSNALRIALLMENMFNQLMSQLPRRAHFGDQDIIGIVR